MKKLDFVMIWNDLLKMLNPGMVIDTLIRGYPNKIVRIDDEGVWVITKKSGPRSKLVPKSMFKKAVEYLIQHGELTHTILTEHLRVMRSAFVMAALSTLQYVEHDSTKARIYIKGQSGERHLVQSGERQE